MRTPIFKKSTAELHRMLDEGGFEDYMIDEIYDELERREREAELFDWTEQDARAHAEELYDLWRREY